MWFILRGIIGNAICGGISLYLGLPKKVADMIDVVLTDEQSLGLSLVIGAIIAWPIVYFLENGFKNTLNSNVSLDDAARMAFEALEGTEIEAYVRRLNENDPLGYYKQAFLSKNVPMHAKRPPSTIIREIPKNDGKVWKIVGNDFYEIHDNDPTYKDVMI